MTLRSFSFPNISLLLFWLRLGCTVLVNLLFLLAILMLTLLLSLPWLKVFLMANGLILSSLLPLVVEYSLPLLVSSSSLAAVTACSVLPDRWFTPHFAVYAEFALSAWDATVDRARTHSPFGLLVSFNVLIALGRLSLLRFNTFGMFTFVRLVSYL